MDSGVVMDAPELAWKQIDAALRDGLRGLAGGSSLAQLLEARCGVRNIGHLKPYTVKQILEWADQHQTRTGRWPNSHSGLIPGADGETWGELRRGTSLPCWACPALDSRLSAVG
jgi:hypothetical protein